MMLRLLCAVLCLLAVSAFAPARAGRSTSLLALSAKEKAETMGKAELVDVLKEKTGISKKDIDTVLTTFMSSIREEVLEGGKEIRLRDFGTFKQKVSLARVGRNPRTGEELQISGGKSVAFSVSSSLKEKDEIKSPKPAAKKA